MSRSGRSVHVEGVDHGAVPIPMGAVVGNLFMSSGISGLRPKEGRTPDTVADQVALMFENVAAVLQAAGGSPADVVKMTVFVRDISSRDAINAEWVKMFPDPADRPARHTLVYALRDPMLVQCEVTALLGRGAP